LTAYATASFQLLPFHTPASGLLVLPFVAPVSPKTKQSLAFGQLTFPPPDLY
jgi:hypothetical protein